MIQEAPVELYWKLEPRLLWEIFARISAVPRPSLKEDRVRRMLQSIATEMHWDTAVDGGGNLIIYVPATKGREDAEPLILQAHMDMVCIKHEISEHNFDYDSIHLQVVEQGLTRFLTARDTTLGADNGIGVAAALAVAMDSTIQHGPLELLFTTNEETGMTGAKQLDETLLRSRRMLNLDSEEDDTVFVGCVGGGKVVMTWDCKPQPPQTNQSYVALFVDGLRGGHSGLEIHQNRGNAIHVLARVLSMLSPDAFRLACIDGGERHNAIPHRAAAVVAGDGSLWQKLVKVAAKTREQVMNDLGENAAKLTILAEPLAGNPPPFLMSAAQSRKIVDALVDLPHGVIGRDAHDAQVIETSSNLAIIQTVERDRELMVETEISTRSLVQERLEDLHRNYQQISASVGARYADEFKYAPWQPDWNSALLRKARTVYKDLFGKRPNATTIHGGLECAIIGNKIPGIDMISIGPKIEEPHTPNERVYIDSVQKFWQFLTALVDNLGRPQV